MSEMGILFLPSGPGLNSGPAKGYLEDLFRRTGPTLLWNEPSATRGDSVPAGDAPAWKNLVNSLVAAARSFTAPYVIVTESYGSILAEVLYAELTKQGLQSGVAGILHTPPTLDLYRVFRAVLRMGEADFHASGDEDRARRMAELSRAVDADPRIDSPALFSGVGLAFESPALMTHYFRTIDTLMRWAGGLGGPGCAPEPEMRDRILRGMGMNRVSLRTTFAPDVPTFVCAGGHDPYESLDAFALAVAAARAVPTRKRPLEWIAFPELGHYPYADAFADWERTAWRPFLALVQNPGRA